MSVIYQAPVNRSWVNFDGHPDGSATDFGWRRNPDNPNQPIYAIGRGVVIYVGNISDGGNTIVIAHDWDNSSVMWAGYMHLSKIDVKVGQSVRMGDKIGNMGSTGKSFGPHLHLRMSKIPSGTKFSWGNFNKYSRLNPLNYVYEYPHQDVTGLQKKPKSKPSKPSTSIKAGDTVTLSKSASKYATGQSIPSWVKGKKYTVQEVSGNKVLLKEIYSWVKVEDVGGKATSAALKAGDKVKVKSSAKKYATGQSIPSWVKGNTYTIQEVSKDKVLLKEIYSWVSKKDVTK